MHKTWCWCCAAAPECRAASNNTRNALAHIDSRDAGPATSGSDFARQDPTRLLTAVVGTADGGDAELRYTLLHRKSSTAVMLASGSISTTLVA